jgi:hypothetical protein
MGNSGTLAAMPVSAAGPVASSELTASDAGSEQPVPEPALPPSPISPAELNRHPGPDPTRYGDWERRGRCIDF